MVMKTSYHCDMCGIEVKNSTDGDLIQHHCFEVRDMFGSVMNAKMMWLCQPCFRKAKLIDIVDAPGPDLIPPKPKEPWKQPPPPLTAPGRYVLRVNEGGL